MHTTEKKLDDPEAAAIAQARTNCNTTVTVDKKVAKQDTSNNLFDQHSEKIERADYIKISGVVLNQDASSNSSN